MSAPKKFTKDELHAYLESASCQFRTDSDGDVYTLLPADDDFGHDVVVYFYIDNDIWLGVSAFADGFDLKDEEAIIRGIAIANDFSIEAKMPKAFVYNNRFRVEQWMIFDDNVSAEFMREYLHLCITMVWRFFVGANKKLNSK